MKFKSPAKVAKTPDWWRHDEILDDVWGNIIADFQRGRALASLMLNEGFPYRINGIGGLLDKAATPAKLTSLALGQLLTIEPLIREKLAKGAQVDDEFTWWWGEFQKCHLILDATWQKYRKALKGKGNQRPKKKQQQRLWYAAWFNWFVEKRKSEKKSKSRMEFDKFFDDLITDLKDGNRKIPADVNKLKMEMMLLGFVSNSGNEYTVSRALSDAKFYGAEFAEYRDIAKAKKKDLPPVGIEYYPLQ